MGREEDSLTGGKPEVVIALEEETLEEKLTDEEKIKKDDLEDIIKALSDEHDKLEHK